LILREASQPYGAFVVLLIPGDLSVPHVPKLLELHRAKEHQIELLALLERELVLVAPKDRPAREAEIVCVTREIDRLTMAIREHSTLHPSAKQSDGTTCAAEEKTKPVIH
jgi:hypothetical protein